MNNHNESSFNWAPRLGRLLGIEVRIHLTFLLLLGFIGLAHWLPERSAASALSGVLFFSLLFGCVLLHELGHALAARQFGIKTRDITLLPIGGVARLERLPEKPLQELWVAVAGPLVNVVIAAGLLAGLGLNGGLSGAGGWSISAGSLVERLLAANVFLVLFNLLPAFPMDGGRVLRALLALRLPHARATRIAARIGQGMAVVFGFAGLFLNPFLILIALFVWVGAAQEANAAEMKSSFSGATVRDAMLTEFQAVAPDETLGDLARRILAGAQQDFPVLDGNGHLVGVVTRDRFFSALRDQGDAERVARIMAAEFPTTAPGEMLETVFSRMHPVWSGMLPVVHDGRLVGLLTAENVGEFFMIRSALQSRGESGHPPSPPDRVPPVIAVPPVLPRFRPARGEVG